MPTTIIEIDTKKSLFDPIEIKIDGVNYPVREMTEGMLEQIQELAKEVEKGSVVAVRKQITLLVDLPEETIKGLTMANLKNLIEALSDKCIKVPSGQEKNG